MNIFKRGQLLLLVFFSLGAISHVQATSLGAISISTLQYIVSGLSKENRDQITYSFQGITRPFPGVDRSVQPIGSSETDFLDPFENQKNFQISVQQWARGNMDAIVFEVLTNKNKEIVFAPTPDTPTALKNTLATLTITNDNGQLTFELKNNFATKKKIFNANALLKEGWYQTYFSFNIQFDATMTLDDPIRINPEVQHWKLQTGTGSLIYPQTPETEQYTDNQLPRNSVIAK